MCILDPPKSRTFWKVINSLRYTFCFVVCQHLFYFLKNYLLRNSIICSFFKHRFSIFIILLSIHPSGATQYRGQFNNRRNEFDCHQTGLRFILSKKRNENLFFWGGYIFNCIDILPATYTKEMRRKDLLLDFR